jgi:hypothetical protein
MNLNLYQSARAGSNLKTVIRRHGVVHAFVDFSNIFPKSPRVSINVWHNTAGDCGPACFYLHQFMEQLGDAAKLLVPGTCCIFCKRLSQSRCPVTSSCTTAAACMSSMHEHQFPALLAMHASLFCGLCSTPKPRRAMHTCAGW